MVAYSTTPALGVNLQQIYTPQSPESNYGYGGVNPFLVGAVMEGPLNAKYIWVLAAENIALYDAVGISEAGAASQLTDTEAGDAWKIGVCSQAAIASGSYGWVQIRGTASVTVAGSCAPDVALVSTAVAGTLDDVTTTGTRIQGIVTTVTNSLTTAAAVACFMAVEPFAELPSLA